MRFLKETHNFIPSLVYLFVRTTGRPYYRAMQSRTKTVLKWTTAVVAVVLIGLSAAGFLLLPRYIETRIVPRLADSLGLDPASVNIRRIGLWGADVGPVRFGDAAAPVIDIASIQVDYSPASLVGGKITGMALAGVRVAIAVTPDGVTLPGWDRNAMTKGGSAAQKPISLRNLIPIQLQWLRIDRGELAIHAQGRLFTIPLDLFIDTAALQQGQLNGRAQLSVLGNPVALELHADQDGNRVDINLGSPAFLMESLALSGVVPDSVQLTGTAALKGKGRLTMVPFGLQDLTLTAALKNARIKAGDALIESAPAGDNAGQPIEARLQSGATDRFQWSLSQFQITTPAVRGVVSGANGEWRHSPSGWSAEAALKARIPAQIIAEKIELTSDLPIGGHLEVQATSDDGIAMAADLAAGRALALSAAKATLHAKNLHAAVKGKLAKGRLEAESKLTAQACRVRTSGTKTTIAGLAVDGTLVVKLPDAAEGSSFSLKTVLSDIESKAGTADLTVPKIDIISSGSRMSAVDQWRFAGTVLATGAKINDPQGKWLADAVSLKMPLAWPPPENGKKGIVKVKAIQWGRRSFGGLQGTVQQTFGGVDVDLRHDSRLLPGMAVLLNGGIDGSGTRLEARLPPFRLDREMDLGRFVPAAAGTMVRGTMSARASMGITGAGPEARGQFLIEQGELHQPDRQLSLKGIRLDMQMDDLIQWNSGPRQKLQIETLQFGKLAAKNLDVNFQVEHPQTLFIEKAAINWCKGRINTAAIRISQGVEEYDVTLFCDRLNLAMVLDQLGAAEASGEGTVNGRIPVQWSNGKLSFDNGFLFSTPGQAGAIQLTGTEVLLSGLPPGTPQHTQLDIATEALKDYTYQWAKLNVTSDADNLLLALKFDGKPNRLLPFAYDQSLGQFKRVAGQGQADFKGISIDLNFTSPLNDIIHYKDLLRTN